MEIINQYKKLMTAIVTDSYKEYIQHIQKYSLDPKEYLYVSCAKNIIGCTFEDYMLLDKSINIPVKEMFKIREYLDSHVK